MRLLSKNSLTRDAALAVLVWRDELTTVTRAAARILHTPGVTILDDDATVVEEGPPPSEPSPWYREVRNSSATLFRRGNEELRRWARWVREARPEDTAATR
jgi:hypothetical protein